MNNGHKKSTSLPTKVVDEPCYKRPYHGFCYTHFNMKTGKILKVWDLDLETLGLTAINVQTLARTLNTAIKTEQLDTTDLMSMVDIMLGFAIDIQNKVDEIGVNQ